MNDGKPQVLSVEEVIRSATMFYIDENLEREISSEVEGAIQDLKIELLSITTEAGLKQYIRTHTDSLDRITSLLNISEEKFKRIITMLRIQKGFMPTGEWSLSAVRNQMIADPAWMDEISALLMRGNSIEKYKTLIPAFYLSNFAIDATTLGRLASDDDIRRLIKKGVEGKYNNKIGDSFFKAVADIITGVCKREGLTYTVKETVALAERAVSIAIPDISHPRILIDITYGITTSSTQTKYAKQTENLAKTLREKNLRKPDRERIVYINVVDGAGWVARQSDLNKIHRSSDYMLNLQSLGVFEDIVKYYL